MSKLSQEEAKSLHDAKESLRIMSGRYGARIIGGTSAVTNLRVISFQVREDSTAFTALVCTDNTTTYGASDFLGGAAAFLAGDTITAPEGFEFTTIHLSAGSVLVTGPDIGL